MSNAKVYWTTFRCKVDESPLGKLNRLITKAGIEQIDFKNKFAAVKIHFGEPGNMSYLRPNWAKAVADKVKARGGFPFLTDCNTLYVGRRNNALVHLDAAAENGFSAAATGCQNIIGDGLKGTDDIEVPVRNGVYCKTARIGRAVMDADIFISLTHFKGHEMAGFGGAVKNIGMGCGSRGGKMAMHSDGKPQVNANCIGCKLCARYCNQDAFTFTGKKAKIDHNKCVGCGRCIGVCNQHAIDPAFDVSCDRMNCKMVEYTQAVLDGRPHFHICIVNQVSPHCDCHGSNDAGIVPDIGMFASFDPVALDKACIDAVNAAVPSADSILNERKHTHKDAAGHADHFTDVHPTTDWRTQISHAEKIGLGTGNYSLTLVK
ncbi:MAG: DUF362 domain-containing protein [Planctomycetaceae bacterium]|nr:DUF362 domain-containing protein [Planctomycetaceae bacterium]